MRKHIAMLTPLAVGLLALWFISWVAGMGVLVNSIPSIDANFRYCEYFIGVSILRRELHSDRCPVLRSDDIERMCEAVGDRAFYTYVPAKGLELDKDIATPTLKAVSEAAYAECKLKYLSAKWLPIP